MTSNVIFSGDVGLCTGTIMKCTFFFFSSASVRVFFYVTVNLIDGCLAITF